MKQFKGQNITHNFSGGVIEQLADDTLMISYTDVVFVEVEHVKATQDLRKKIMGGNRYFAVIDMRNGFVKFSKEAKRWAADNPEGAEARIMDVFLVNSLIRKIEVQIYLRFFKPKVKTVVVSSIDEAIKEIDKHRVVSEEVKMTA